MPANGSSSPSLAHVRKELESVDRSIVLLLAARLDAAQRALKLRAGPRGRITDVLQERRVLRRGRGWARELGLPEKLVDHLFRTLMEEGKARYRRGGGETGELPFVTVQVTPPDRSPVLLGDLSSAELGPVPAPR